MITVSDNILRNVFYIRVGKNTGTCFCINYRGKKYLVTAKHMVKKEDTIDIDILKNGTYEHQKAKVFFSDNDEVDIIVLQVTIDETIKGINILKEQPNVEAGQEMYFLGFPFGMVQGEYSYNNGYPIPFVKRAFLSCANGLNGYAHLWLDGTNNPGFSGGPVIYESVDEQTRRPEQYLAGVISSYRCDVKSVLKEDTGETTGYIYQENAGIINAHGKASIIDIIEKNNI